MKAEARRIDKDDAAAGVSFERLGEGALRSLIESTFDGILIVDAEGVVRYANRSAQAMFGQRHLVGSDFGIPMTGEGTELEIPDGESTKLVEARSVRATIEGSNVFLVSLHDITDRRAAEQERERARRQAETVARTRNALLNMAAHELRTPVTVITGYLSMLNDESLGPIPDSWRDVIPKVNEKADELRVMVDEILMAARLEAGRVGRDAEDVDLRDVVRAAMRRATGRGPMLRAQIRIELPDQPVPTLVDPSQVGIVLDNLINNALKYSSDDEPWLEVLLRVRDGRAEVTVSDHGIGIPPEMQQVIFEPFRRITSPDGLPRAGTGLGLAIARDLARLNQGDIRLLGSEPGKGSRFVLELPIAGAE